jgi:tryptophanyl-tRNA synthetase
MNSIVVTGDRPTGQLHLGHYVGSLTQRLELQHQHEMFILIADTQVLNNDISKSQEVKKHTLSLMRDYLGVGLNPEKIHFVLQSRVPALFELTQYLSNLVSLSFVMRNPTIKNENKLYNHDLNMGFLNYPISQTSDIVLFNGELVPVGADQVPILEFANDVIEKFHGNFKCNVFKKIQPLLSSTPRLCGLDGNNKMSKSLNNAIFLSDSLKDLKKKINSMYTDRNHLAISDPGQIEGNVVFTFLDIFMEDRILLEEFKAHYQRGGLGDSYLKNILFDILSPLLESINSNGQQFSDSYLKEVLDEGTQYANQIANEQMNKIRDIIFL